MNFLYVFSCFLEKLFMRADFKICAIRRRARRTVRRLTIFSPLLLRLWRRRARRHWRHHRTFRRFAARRSSGSVKLTLINRSVTLLILVLAILSIRTFVTALWRLVVIICASARAAIVHIVDVIRIGVGRSGLLCILVALFLLLCQIVARDVVHSNCQATRAARPAMWNEFSTNVVASSLLI